MERRTPAGDASLSVSETSPLLASESAETISAGAAVSNGTYESSKSTASAEVTEVREADIGTRGVRADGQGAAESADQGGPTVNRHVLLPAVGIGVFLCALDQLLAVATYAKIGSDLNALNSTSWIATAYFLTLTSCQPLYGKLSDIFGRKACLLFAYTVFGLGCLGCGLAADIVQLVVARALAGVGGGGMNAVVSILLTDFVPLADRGIWQGYLNIIFAAGTATGAPLGGLLADSLGWRWSFLGQVPLCAAAFAAVYFGLDLPPRDTAHWREKLRRVDFLGAAVLVSAVLCLLVGLDNGSNRGWAHPLATLAPLAASVVLFAAFVLVELHWATHPFAPGHVIFDRALFAAFACNFLSMAGHMPVLFTLPLLYQAADGVSAARAGALLMPGSLFSVAASLGAGALMKRTGRYYWLTVASLALLLLSVVPLALFANGFGRRRSGGVSGPAEVVGTNVPGTVVALAMTATGGGSAVTTTLIALLANAAPEDTAVVIACSYLFRSLGSSVGISIGSAVLQQVLRTRLTSALRRGGGGGGRRSEEDARRIADRVRESLDYIGELDPAVGQVVRQCYQSGVVAVFLGCTVFLLPALISGLFLRNKKIKR